MNNPAVSVILPVYNAERYLLAALQSISNQTYEDFELIVIDDGSTDGSLEILQSYCKSESRLRIISRENRGLVDTLNEAIPLCRGEWIARMDADDISLPQRLEKQLQWAIDNQAVLCGGGIQGIDENGTFLPGSALNFPVTRDGVNATLLFESAFAHPAVIIRKDVIAKFLYSKEAVHAEDYELWTRIALSGLNTTNLPEVVLLYRVHQMQISQAKATAQNNAALRIAEKYWKELLKGKNIPFFACLVDCKAEIPYDDLRPALNSLKQIRLATSEPLVLNMLDVKRELLLYRATSFGFKTLGPLLKKQNITLIKKIWFAFLASIYAGRLLKHIRGTGLVKYLTTR